MGIAWFALAPLAIMIPTFVKPLSKISFLIHMVMMLTVAALTVVGFAYIIDFKEENGLGHFNTIHGRAGLAIFTIVVVQVVNGLFRPDKPQDSTPKNKKFFRSAWEGFHHVLGRTLPIIAVYSLYSGVNNIENIITGPSTTADAIRIAILAVMSVYLFLWFSAKLWHKWKESQGASEPTPSMIKLNQDF
eukprot:Pgem_evm1s7214